MDLVLPKVLPILASLQTFLVSDSLPIKYCHSADFVATISIWLPRVPTTAGNQRQGSVLNSTLEAKPKDFIHNFGIMIGTRNKEMRHANLSKLASVKAAL